MRKYIVIFDILFAMRLKAYILKVLAYKSKASPHTKVYTSHAKYDPFACEKSRCALSLT